MIIRHFWVRKIEEAWKLKSVLWLSGVRRVGKTVLGKSLPGVEYFDCELPRVRRMMDDPEAFLSSVRGKRVVLDEIHRLDNPSELLKIAFDHYPSTKIFATGSSSLGASKKFKDTLTGRKVQIWMTPMMSEDLKDFNATDLKHRLLRGGLPPFFLAEDLPEPDFQEWMDSYWAKDIQELFRLERRHSFQKFVELLLASSGSIFEATKYTGPCEASRGTIMNYLKVLEATYVAHILHPYHSKRSSEIIAAPKIYGFDTGFVCYHKGWDNLRTDDLGFLWEHYVLNELQAQFNTRGVQYWRDKRGHEVDLILSLRGGKVFAVECKWSDNNVDTTNLHSFNVIHPKAICYVVAQNIDRHYERSEDGLKIKFVNLSGLIQDIRLRIMGT